MTNKNDTYRNVNKLIGIIKSYSHNIVRDLSPLYQLADSLKISKSDKGLLYNLNDLEFINISTKQFLSSRFWKVNTLSVKLNLSVSLNPNESFEYHGIKEATVEIVYEALDGSSRLTRGAWHLDCHSYEGSPKFIHPNFHIHHGGRRIKDHTTNYGEILLLDAPRLMHPPLDLFLAFDLILTNFFERKIWNEFRADEEYRALVKSSHESWWREYYCSIANYWSHPKGSLSEADARKKARIENPFLFE